tara:strand:+ start:118 stop:228 length:111 start_codon:yes stop_codon:yes gene_type:complete
VAPVFAQEWFHTAIGVVMALLGGGKSATTVITSYLD